MSSMSDDEELLSKLDNLDLKTTLNEDIAVLDTEEFHLPSVDALPTLESILGEDDQGNPASPSNSGSAQHPTDTVSESGSMDSLGGEGLPTHLRHTPLLGIASQLQSAADRVSAGAPTALTAGAVIVVGTSHGLCLVFETHEAMRYCLGDSRSGQQLGAVSCLHLSPDGSRLIAGYARGQIQVYDVTQGKLVIAVNEANLRSTAIIHLRFTDVPDVALFSDSGGSVFELRLRRSLVRRSAAARCLFSGSRGEVVTMEPLPTADHPSHPLQQQMIVAMATMSKVIVVSVRPQLKVLFTYPLEAGPIHVPLIDWQFVVIRVGSGLNMVDPVLTFARKSTVYFYQVCCPGEQTKFVPLQWVEFPFVIQNLKWMNSRTLALIDTQEKLHLWDVRGQQQLETLDLSFVKMVYSTSYFKGLATGGNVSKAMAVAGEKACFESCLVSGGQLMLLGTRGVHVLTLRTWLERLEAHVRSGEFSAALRLAWTLYGERNSSLVGLQGSSGRRQAIIKERMLSLIDEWLDYCLRSPSSDQLLSQAVPTCVQYLLDLDESGVLFGRVASLLESEPAGGPLLLDALLPHIISGRLTAPPPLTMQQLVTHLEQQDRLQTLEECLVRAEIASLDINQVLPLCWRRGLYDAIVRIHTVGMGDYISPLLEMLARLASLLSGGAPLMDGQAQLGNKLLVYVSSCLAGRGYPDGQIPAQRVHEVKLGVLSALTAVHSKNAADSERPYPHLRTLLTFDTREFLNVLSLSFEEDVFCSELGMRQRQRIVDILLTLMVDTGEYSPSQLGSLFTFIARQMALPNSTISVSRDLFDKVVDHLTVPGDTAHHEERQQALAELISTGVLQHYDTERLAQLAEAAKFYRICELLFEGRGEHDRTAGCMLRHGGGRASLHRFVAERAAAERTAPVPPPRDAASIALHFLQDLLDIDLDQTATLFTSCLCRHLEDAVQKLDSSPEQRYRFLGAILQQSSSMVLPGSVYGQYLSLMCQLEPDRVPQFISEQDTFDHDQYLKICRAAGNREGEAYLLDRNGDTAGALQTLLDGLDDAEQQTSGRLISRLTAAVRLCQRSAGRLPDPERRRCWFALLERAVAFQQPPHDSEQMKCLVPLVVSSMIGHVPLPEVMRRLLREPAYSGGQLGHLRPLLTDLLRTCQYERVLYDSARRITQADTRDGHVQKRHVWSRGYGAPGRCHVCGRRPDLQRGQMLAFRCGHFCHPGCAPPAEGGSSRTCGLCRGRRVQTPLGRDPGTAAADGDSAGAAGDEAGAGVVTPAVAGAGPTSPGLSLADMLQAEG